MTHTRAGVSIPLRNPVAGRRVVGIPQQISNLE